MANDKSSRVTPEKILGALKTKKTVTDLAEKLSVSDATVRKLVKTLLTEGKISKVGVTETGSAGRPATYYQAPQAEAAPAAVAAQ